MILLFYSYLIFFLGIKIYLLFNPGKLKISLDGFIMKMKQIKDSGDMDDQDAVIVLWNLLKLGGLVIFGSIYFIFTFVGLLSSDWFYFFILILLDFFSIKSKSRTFNYVESFISMSLLLFIILNHFHFHFYIF